MWNHLRLPCDRGADSVAHGHQTAVKHHRDAAAYSVQLKWIRLRWVEGIANFLVKNLGFFFIPPGVALMLHLNVIKAQLMPIVVASAVSTVVVIVVTGWIHQLVRKYQHRQFTKRHGIH